MFEHFEAICRGLLQPRSAAGILPILDPTEQFKTEDDGPAALAAKLNAANLLEVMGVDGEYGRHYSFSKAIAAFWKIFIQPDIKGTFKIDLDQVFPEEDLVEQTGASAFEHFKTPLWGAKGLDSFGNPVELGMIAGALVDEKDIAQSIFTPDVSLPDRKLLPDEHIFFSLLPQAISTEAEMMTRYDTLEAVEGALEKNCPYANDLKRKAHTLIDQCAVGVIKR